MKILHIINSLDIGGAEKMLVKLACSDVFVSDEMLIVTLLEKGALAPEIEKAVDNVQNFHELNSMNCCS